MLLSKLRIFDEIFPRRRTEHDYSFAEVNEVLRHFVQLLHKYAELNQMEVT